METLVLLEWLIDHYSSSLASSDLMQNASGKFIEVL